MFFNLKDKVLKLFSTANGGIIFEITKYFLKAPFRKGAGLKGANI
jgi:hypothetical protein